MQKPNLHKEHCRPAWIADPFYYVRQDNPQFSNLDFHKEAMLIREKKSKLSANERRFVLECVEIVDTFNASILKIPDHLQH